MLYSTMGRDIFSGHELMMYYTEQKVLEPARVPDRYRLVYIGEGSGVFKNGEKSEFFTAPVILCLNERDEPELIETTGLKLEVLYFEPSVIFDERLTIDNINSNNTYNHGWFYSPFLQRNDFYIGLLPLDYLLPRRIAQLFDFVQDNLTHQRDTAWPCRSRSYLIELIILVSSLYDQSEHTDRLLAGWIPDEMQQVLKYLHSHYQDKVTIDTLVTEFHTNKTTLNQKFKEATGFTIMNIAWSVGNGRNVRLTTNGGKNWTAVTDYNANGIQSYASFCDDQTGLVGSAVKFGLTVDGGNTWTDVKLPKEGMTIASLFLSCAEQFYVLSDEGVLYCTGDGGKTYTEIPLNLGDIGLYDLKGNKGKLIVGRSPVNTMSFTDDKHGIICMLALGENKQEGYKVYVLSTEDGGETWDADIVGAEFGFIPTNIYISRDGSYLTLQTRGRLVVLERQS